MSDESSRMYAAQDAKDDRILKLCRQLATAIRERDVARAQFGAMLLQLDKKEAELAAVKAEREEAVFRAMFARQNAAAMARIRQEFGTKEQEDFEFEDFLERYKHERAEVERLRASLVAARRLLDARYVEWGRASTGETCEHGYNVGLDCPACDLAQLNTALNPPVAPPSDRINYTHSE